MTKEEEEEEEEVCILKVDENFMFVLHSTFFTVYFSRRTQPSAENKSVEKNNNKRYTKTH